MLTAGEILYRVAAKTQIDPTAQANYINGTMFRFLQDVYRKIWNASVWPELIADDFTLVVPGNSLEFILPKQYDAIQRAYNLDTGQPLKIRDRSSFADVAYQYGQQFTQTTLYDSITRLNPSPILTASPTATAQNFKVLCSAADTSKVFLRGLDANGERISEVITLNGTTPVPSANTYLPIEAWSKTTVPTGGYVTLTDNAGNILGTLGEWETVPKYERYMVDGQNPTPMNLQLTCKRSFVPFLHFFDYPFTELDLVLIDGVCSLVWDEHKKLDLAANAERKSNAALDEITDREENQDDVVLFVPQQRG